MNEKKRINRLKVVLAEKNKTNKWLAEATGRSQNTVSRWCGNKMQPTAEAMVDIAKALDVEVGELYSKIK